MRDGGPGARDPPPAAQRNEPLESIRSFSSASTSSYVNPVRSLRAAIAFFYGRGDARCFRYCQNSNATT
jgi:hypothetical protein